MPNLKLANEWLEFAERNLETAKLLNNEYHYTDVIAIDIQQSIEKALKAVYVFNGVKIPRTHALEILFSYADNWIDFGNIEKKDLIKISDFYQTERYPGPKYFMPERKEINESIKLAEKILYQIQRFVNK